MAINPASQVRSELSAVAGIAQDLHEALRYHEFVHGRSPDKFDDRRVWMVNQVCEALYRLTRLVPMILDLEDKDLPRLPTEPFKGPHTYETMNPPTDGN